MPFAFNQIQPTTIGTVDKWDIPLNRWLGVKFGAGYDDGLGSAVSNFTEDQIYDEGPVMKPDFATKTFGIPGHLKFGEPISIGRASLLRRRKEAELEKAAYLESASHGWFSAKAFAGFGASMVGGFAHPLDLGTAFIPFVGSSTRAAELARFGAGPLERGLARGLLTEEGIAAARIPFPRLSASIVEGVLSQAAVEVPIGIEKFRSQADYGIEDAATNILAGGAFAGGLHLSVKALSSIWKKLAEVHSRLTPETRDALIREHESALMEGREPDTAKIISVDENAIRERLRFDEAAARRDALRAEPLGLNRASVVDPELRSLSEEQFDAEFRAARDEVDKAEKTLGTSAENKEAIALAQDRWSAADNERFRRNIKDVVPADLMRKLLAEVNNPERIRIIADEMERQGASLQEFLAETNLKSSDEAEVFSGKLEKVREALSGDTATRQAVADARQRQIEQIIQAKKAEHEASMEGRVSAEVEAERARQIAEGRILPPETVREYEFKSSPDDADIAVIERDAKTLEKDILNRVTDPEEQAALKEELAQLQDLIYKDDGKSVKAALPCVGRIQ